MQSITVEGDGLSKVLVATLVSLKEVTKSVCLCVSIGDEDAPMCAEIVDEDNIEEPIMEGGLALVWIMAEVWTEMTDPVVNEEPVS